MRDSHCASVPFVPSWFNAVVRGSPDPAQNDWSVTAARLFRLCVLRAFAVQC